MKILHICPNCNENMHEDEIDETECFNCGTSLIEYDEMSILKESRVRSELAIRILKLINNFESSEEPDYGKLSNNDIIYVLSSLIVGKVK